MKEKYLSFAENSVWATYTPGSTTAFFSPIVTEAGHFYAFPDYCVMREHHESCLLLYTLNGNGKITLPSQTFVLSPGSFCVIDCNIPHRYESYEQNWEFLWMHMAGPGIREMYNAVFPEPFSELNDKYRDAFTEAFDSLLETMSLGDTISFLKIQNLTSSILYYTGLSLYGDKAESPDSLPARCARLIDSRYGRKLTIDEIADELHVSKYHLIRTFKRAMGIPPYSYLTMRRISKAKEKLVFTNDPIAEIAEKCGFNDCAGFISCFKQRTGQTPLQYRKGFKL
ncbi:MAG: helix-turn-helix domain-containing protein [Lachnospiraceae bacterium]|nr:helix-turn-helix domain-containing protein [Lachnospiraceae bacterium]